MAFVSAPVPHPTITLEPVAQSHVDAALSILAGLEFNVSPPLALPMTP